MKTLFTPKSNFIHMFEYVTKIHINRILNICWI